MRLLRVLAVATGFAALLSQSSAAQDERQLQFKDSWFWGAKAGAMSFSSATTTNGGAPLVGVDWLITRSEGGLYLSYDQAFLTAQGGLLDQTADSVFVRPVRLKNLRRFTAAAMIFPMQSRTLHPYAGLGFVMNQIASAQLLTASADDPRLANALAGVQSARTAFSPVIMAGVQARRVRYSIFAQGSASPMQESFFLSNSSGTRAFNFSLELGARYNVGSSVDQSR
jgi:hypothetical protein